MAITAYAKDTQPLHPEACYPLAAWCKAAGVSKTRIHEAKLLGVPLPTFTVGKRVYIQGADGIEWLRTLSAKLAELEVGGEQ
ncbi:hypothetical protein Pla175_05560 [Pirellulimonas nuda]|uniref:Uncharacterized protein n=1 Tax=Pirellulimonas nuda TaxID=2528009 RepID=A0A518D6X5_9BACT|nr:hypothetical protein [Pirellulimonas nuda]QDU87199.1 hypothetical protein Pla175_05560 [Pirellulimonas nuda]